MRRAAATWDAEALKKYNRVGGSGWDSIAYDPDTSLIYFGTGNAGPWPEDNVQESERGNSRISPRSQRSAARAGVRFQGPVGGRRSPQSSHSSSVEDGGVYP